MKKMIAFMLLAAMALSLLVGCGANGPTTAGNRTITDGANRQVEVPEKVESIVCVGVGALRYSCYMGAADLVIGVEDYEVKAGMTRLYQYVNFEKFKDLPVIGTNGQPYTEEIINLAPDVIVMSKSASVDADDLQEKTGTPVVVVPGSDTTLDQDCFDTIRILGELYGLQARADALTTYLQGLQKDLDDRTKDIPDSEKLTAYTGAVTFSGRHGFAGTYANFGPFMGVNALNVADEVKDTNYFETDLEKVVEWDPDVIFLDPGNMDLVNDEYKTNPGYFHALRAVQEGQLYTMPSFNNCSTNITYAIMNAYYAGIVLYPEAFADVDMATIGGQILETMLGENFFEEMEAGGLYYGKLTLGQ